MADQTPPGANDTKTTKKKTTKKPQGNEKEKAEPTEAGPTEAELLTKHLADIRVTDNRIKMLFESHEATEEQAEQIKRINRAGAAMAQVITNETRNGEDRRAAIRKIKEATMTAIVGVIHSA